MRFCAKIGCDGEAACCCGFDYAQRLVWLAPLGRERDPSAYDLCAEHAASLRVPRGWDLEDHREAEGAAGELEELFVGDPPLPNVPGPVPQESPETGSERREPRLVPQIGAALP